MNDEQIVEYYQGLDAGELYSLLYDIFEEYPFENLESYQIFADRNDGLKTEVELAVIRYILLSRY